LIFSGACDCLEGNRAEKLKSIEVALKYNQKMSKEANSSQSSLFSGEDSFLSAQPKLVQSEELKNSELLQFEKDAFGFYFLQSPLDKHKEDLVELSNTGIEKSTKKFKQVRLGGIITDVKILYDKRNNQWAIINLDCISGSAEIFAFSKTYEKYSNLLIEDNKIFIQGKPSDREEDPEKPKVIADNIYTLKAIRSNLARSINIKIPYTYQDPKILDKIKEVANSYPGKLPLVLFLENSDQTFNKVRFAEIRLSPDSRCLKEIRLKLDQSTVRIGI
jgi:DNA polymerase-3 subunit alpha